MGSFSPSRLPDKPATEHGAAALKISHSAGADTGSSCTRYPRCSMRAASRSPAVANGARAYSSERRALRSAREGEAPLERRCDCSSLGRRREPKGRSQDKATLQEERVHDSPFASGVRDERSSAQGPDALDFPVPLRALVLLSCRAI